MNDAAVETARVPARVPRNLPQAFPYQGSKRKLAPSILKCMPRGYGRLVEPFAGSAAVSIAAAALNLTDRFVLNDAHQPLINLWDRIINDPNGLSDEYAGLWDEQHGRSREHYDEVRDIFNQSKSSAHFLYLLARCVKAAIRYNRMGQFNNSPDKRRLGMQPATMRRNLLEISELLRGRTELRSADYAEVLREVTPGDIVYMDPPYQGVCKERDNRYAKAVAFDDFVAELDRLNTRNIAFLVSYDGRTGDLEYGRRLPDSLRLIHREVYAGRSTQATLLGRGHDTYESLYLSPALAERLGRVPPLARPEPQSFLFAD